MTMGTASTMTSAAEALGWTLPGAASIPAVDANHQRMATDSGRRIVEMVWEDLKPSDLLTAASFDNAITTVLALGGSTNSLVHLIAMARRAGIDLLLQRFDELSRTTPLLANLRPAGKYLMEDFYYAGGLRAVLAELGELIDAATLTINAKTLGENIAGADIYNDDVIRHRENRCSPTAAWPCCRQSRARRCGDQTGRDGATTARPPRPRCRVRQLRRSCRAHRRSGARRGARSVLVLRSAGPIGGPGFPEWGQLPIPKKMLAQGVRDMVRISDARMSGTSYGACVLHVAPESAVGGPLALVRDRRRDRARRAAARAESSCRCRRARTSQAGVACASATLRARLRRAILASYHTSQ